MSTVRRRQGLSPADRFRYGWRDVPVRNARGRVIGSEQVPLTREDVLHPQEGDHIMTSDHHGNDCAYLRNVFRAQLASAPHALVFSDLAIYWDIPALRHHCPDVSVILGVRDPRRDDWPSFHVAAEGVRPVLLIEVTSPSTRRTDFREKRRQYFLAGVPLYVIIDAREGDDRRELEIIGYRPGPTRYQRLPLSDDGRLWLDVVGLWLGSEDGRVVCYDAQGQRIADYLEMAQGRAAAEEAAEQERRRREAAERRLRELEAELRRAQGEA
jgi:Uma2 family endonuclease